MSAATVGHTLKLAMYRAAQTLYPAGTVRVSFGHPGDRADLRDIVAFTTVRTEQDPATQSPLRARNEHIYLTVMISCFRAGELEDDLVPSDAAYNLLAQLETYVRVTNTTLGGACYWCFLENTISDGVTDKQLLARGRLIQIEAEFHAFARITT